MKMTEQEKAELAKAVIELLRQNGEVRSAVFKLVCSCPNVVTQY
jgi:hypothetical protein